MKGDQSLRERSAPTQERFLSIDAYSKHTLGKMPYSCSKRKYIMSAAAGAQAARVLDSTNAGERRVDIQLDLPTYGSNKE